ncbi:hypothetical protein L6164_029024 [Bauhinia variegata]|uniref:Uncharacterized protein n=1 Tax=Bauhinia variegata TaxID=167791 RepID=A0ACB9L7Y6_BAUVA|nr:hypothetical protein L6164_029024 [Bauhinia variegata]
MVSSDGSADHNVSSAKLQQTLSPHSGSTVSEEIHYSTINSSKTEGTKNIPPAEAEKEAQNSDATTCIVLSGQEGSTCSLALMKPSQIQIPNTVSHALQSGQDSPSIVREKVSKDGYNWRKYGQKHVKGNEFIRSYYKCTHPNCLAKKQLEQSHSGQVTDTVCIGQHNHPRPQLSTVPSVDFVVPTVKERLDKPSLANTDDEASTEHGCVPQQKKPLDSLPISTVSSCDEVKSVQLQSALVKHKVHNKEDPESKRLKKDNHSADVTGVEKSTSESRVVVKTSSEVDFVNDGYRWRKYGQKLVKGSPNPRSYYRCSNPGCPAKKHVERDSHDPKVVITTYEGKHNHEMPPGRTVTQNAAADTQVAAANNGASGTKSGGTSELNDQLNSKLGSKPKDGVTNHPSEDHRSKSSKQEKVDGNSSTSKDSVSFDVVGHSSSGVRRRSHEQLKDNIRAKSEENEEDRPGVISVHDTHGTEGKLNKRPKPDSESVQS